MLKTDSFIIIKMTKSKLKTHIFSLITVLSIFVISSSFLTKKHSVNRKPCDELLISSE